MSPRFASAVLLATILFGVGTIAAIAIHAAKARANREREGLAVFLVVSRLPSSNLALAGGSRHLRALGLEENTAPFTDSIGSPDPDPAGGALLPR